MASLIKQEGGFHASVILREGHGSFHVVLCLPTDQPMVASALRTQPSGRGVGAELVSINDCWAAGRKAGRERK